MTTQDYHSEVPAFFLVYPAFACSPFQPQMWTFKAKLRVANGLADPAAVLCLSEHPASSALGRSFTDPIPTRN